MGELWGDDHVARPAPECDNERREPESEGNDSGP